MGHGVITATVEVGKKYLYTAVSNSSFTPASSISGGEVLTTIDTHSLNSRFSFYLYTCLIEATSTTLSITPSANADRVIYSFE